MENKNVGWLIIGISFIMGIIVFLFDRILRQNLGLTCSHGSSCGMYSSLNVQGYISFAIAGIILLIGIYLIFSKPKERIVIQKVKEKIKTKKIDLSGLEEFEKKIVEYIQSENGAVFQRTLMEKFEIGKVKTTRTLDKLEAKQIIERKRRGMNNIIILKK